MDFFLENIIIFLNKVYINRKLLKNLFIDILYNFLFCIVSRDFWIVFYIVAYNKNNIDIEEFVNIKVNGILFISIKFIIKIIRNFGIRYIFRFRFYLIGEFEK